MIYIHYVNKIITSFNTHFYINILQSKLIKCFDIENIDYQYIEKLYNKKIPQELLIKKYGHERPSYHTNFDEFVYNLPIEKYYNHNIEIKYFYNQELLEKIYNFYKNDFDFFKKYGIHYTITN
jgi:hypothetical protein